MSEQWYMSRDGETQYGPYEFHQLQEFATDDRLLPGDQIWKEDMPSWVAASTVEGLAFAPPKVPTTDSNKILAGVMGIVLGGLGVHKFILGMTTPGIIMAAVTLLTCGVGGAVMGVIGLIEGIIYLSMSDEKFHTTYIVNKKEWF